MQYTSKVARDFYIKVLETIRKNNVPFLIGGGFALFEYTHIRRPTKDLDIFCKAGSYPKIVTLLKDAGINIQILDERWLAKAVDRGHHVDLLFSSPNYLITIDDSWFEHSVSAELFGIQVKMIPKEELIWCKAYVQERGRFDGADINHIILQTGKQIDWKRLLMRMETHWDLFLSILINFRFVYPSQRDLVPKWLMEELISRLTYQINNPTPIDKICRGPLLSRTQYKIDMEKLGFEVIT
ncbi:nucleotidyltransferase [Candidatus Daviesbacteria bacterium]|nr:nucleotidyltransferase [Candidatus Daviesbacteria bacterium]